MRAPTPVCGTAPPKPRLWSYEKEALAPQPESGLALFSSLEGARTWLGGKECQRLSVSHPRLGELDARLDCCYGSLLRERATTADWTSSKRGPLPAGGCVPYLHAPRSHLHPRAGTSGPSAEECGRAVLCAAFGLRGTNLGFACAAWGRHLTTCPPGGQATLESVDHWPMAILS